MNEKTYTTFQIADICGVRPTTIIKWVKQNKLKAFVTLGGHRRVKESELLQFLTKNGFPVPEELQGLHKRVLIVEDEESIGQMISRSLQKASPNVEIQWTTNGIEALLALGKSPIDLVVLDVIMPVVDGAQVLATLRADPKTRNLKVIGMTGKRLPAEKQKFFQNHTDAFFSKPFDLEEFTHKAVALLGLAQPAEAAAKAKAK